MRRYLLGWIVFVLIAAPAGAQDFDETVKGIVERTFIVRLGEATLARCTGVAEGEIIGNDGQRIFWPGYGDIRRRHDRCQDQLDQLRIKFRQRYPTRILELKKSMKEYTASLDKDVAEVMADTDSDDSDELTVCVILNTSYEALTDSLCK